MSKTVSCALGDIQYMHNVYGPVEDVKLSAESHPDEGNLEWLHVFTTFAYDKPAGQSDDGKPIHARVLLLRAIRGIDDIVWITDTDTVHGSTFALGFLPKVFHDKTARAATLDIFEKEFRRLVNNAVKQGTYATPELAVDSFVGAAGSYNDAC